VKKQTKKANVRGSAGRFSKHWLDTYFSGVSREPGSVIAAEH
jgi:hypothetical protein